MENTPVARRQTAIGAHMQAVLHSASKHPPPTPSLNAASGATVGAVAPELMAVSGGLDLAILCKNNTIRAVNLLHLPDDDVSVNSSSNGDHNSRTRRGAQPPQVDPALLNPVSFAANCAPRPGDDTIPSDSIPAKTAISGLEFSPSGHSLLVWGESYVAVARLPRSSAIATRNTNNSTSTSKALDVRRSSPTDSSSVMDHPAGARWKWTLVDMSGYAVDIMRQRIVQAAWHPASDSCVTLLTVGKDDGIGGVGGGGKAFVMLHVPGRDRPEKVLPIPEGSSKSPPVAVAHGHGAGWQRFAVWIARRDGSVAALCPVVPQTAKVDSEELLDLWSATCDKLVAARWERSRTARENSENQSALDEEIAYAEQQMAWLKETFGDLFDNENPNCEGTIAASGSATTTQRRRSRGGDTGAGSALALAMPRYPVLQDDIVLGRETGDGSNDSANLPSSDAPGGAEQKRGQYAGAACGLVVLRGAGTGADAGEAAAVPPTVLAVAYRSGRVDLVLVPAGLAPRWAERVGSRVSWCASPGLASPALAAAVVVPPGAVFESLDLAERLTDKSSRRRQEGLALSAGDAPWTLLAATSCRLTSISVTWASRVEKAAEHARERAARRRSEFGGGSGDRLDGDLRAVLRERPDSAVAEVFFVPPCAEAGRIVGAVPVSKPEVGHLALTRLSGGAVELVNLSVITIQATEVASAAKRARAQETPGRGDMLPPFEAALQKAVDALEEWRMKQPLGSALRNAGHLLMSDVDKQGAHAVEKEASKLVDGGVEVLEKLHLKTNTRLQTLREVYEHQAGVIAKMSKDVGRLRTGQLEAEDTLEKIFNIAEDEATRSASVLAIMQATRPDVSPAERVFISEIKDMENYADRQQVMLEPAAKQVEELKMAEREAEDFLLREAHGLGGSGAGGRGGGTGLSERETRDVWNMLQADRERVLNLSRRLESARARLGELGVREEE